MSEDIQKLRMKIDEIDENILKLLSERSEVCRSIGLLKKQSRIPVIDPERQSEIYAKIKGKAADFALDGSRVEEIYRQIVNMCSSVQEFEEKSE